MDNNSSPLPRCSVVITTHNRVALLPRAIESVLAQSHPADEVIVIDDGSSDDTAGLMRRYSHDNNIRYHYQSHTGISAARNTGIRRSTHSWIAFLDDDDSWLPEKLQQQLTLLQQNPKARWIHCNEQWLRCGIPLAQKKKHQRHAGWIFRHCLPLCCVSPSSVMIHRSIFQSVGDFDETLPVCEDYDLWLRISVCYPILLATEALVVKHGGHTDQLSQRVGMDQFRIRALHKCLSSNYLNPRDYLAACAQIVQKINIWLNGARKHGNDADLDKYLSLLHHYQRSLQPDAKEVTQELH